jgi:hypothetical protein
MAFHYSKLQQVLLAHSSRAITRPSAAAWNAFMVDYQAVILPKDPKTNERRRGRRKK